MATARAIDLRVRPLQSVDLSFPIDGIVGVQSDIHLLGKQVKAFDLNHFYGLLGEVISPMVEVVTGSSHGNVAGTGISMQPLGPQPLGWGRLKYDSSTIHEQLKAFILYELRAEHIKAAVDKGVAQRENAWIQKFENSVYEATIKAYSRDDPNAKLGRVQTLTALSQLQHNVLKTQYVADTNSAVYNMSNGVVKGTLESSLETTSSGTRWTPTTVVSGSEYSAPAYDNDARFHRAQIALDDEALAALAATNYVSGSSELEGVNVVSGRGSPGGLRYFQNDLRSIDLDVKRLQLAYVDTLLISPIDGVVTGVFRNVGDSVRATQAVVRVENDAEILLVGTLKFPGLLRIGQTIAVSTTVSGSGQSLSVSGSVVAVRGHDSENELWDVLISCSNRDGAGLPIFPINYNFDFDMTSVVVS